jgi:hypothetical protein
MSEDELFEVTTDAILQAALGESRGGDQPSYDHAMELMAESQRRLTEDGHGERCQSGVYSRAFEKVTATHAGRKPEPQLCGCGRFA